MKRKIMSCALALAMTGPLWADTVYPSAACAFDLDTREVKELATASEALAVAYSGSEWGAAAGTATVAVSGRHAATLAAGAADDGTVRFVPTDSGFYTLTHTSDAPVGETLTAQFLLRDIGEQQAVAFNLDTRTGIRTVSSADDLLPIAYSGSDWGLYAGTADVRATYEMMYEDYVAGGAGDGVKRWLPTTNYGAGSYVLRVNSTAAGAEELSAEFDCQFAADPETLFDGWAAAQGLTGDDAAWDAKPAIWGGEWANAFIYTYGEGLADGTLAIMAITIDAEGMPVITTTPVIEGHTDFTPAVIGSPSVSDWNTPVVLENTGDDWTLPAGAEANFFRVVIP